MSAHNTPQLEAVTETNSTMTLSGSLLGASAAGLQVQIGAYTCGSVTNLSPTLSTCVIPVGAAGPAAISVYVDGYGYANVTSSANATYVFPLSVTSPLRVAAGSTAGGAVITLSGAGFYPDPPNSGTSGHNHITFGSSSLGAIEGFVRSSNETTLVVVVPPAYVAAVVDVSVYVESADLSDTVASVTLPGAFSYVTGITGTLSRVSPTAGAGAAGSRLVITGTNLGAANAANAVRIGGVACAITGWTATQVNCTLGATPAGLHTVFVYTFPFGYATAGSVKFSASLAVTGVSGATSPGLGGGATLTVRREHMPGVPLRACLQPFAPPAGLWLGLLFRPLAQLRVALQLGLQRDGCDRDVPHLHDGPPDDAGGDLEVRHLEPGERPRRDVERPRRGRPRRDGALLRLLRRH